MVRPVAEVLAVRYGTRATRRSEVYLHFDAYGEPDAELIMDYYFWVIRLDGRTMLIDCGFNDASGGRGDRTKLCPPGRGRPCPAMSNWSRWAGTPPVSSSCWWATSSSPPTPCITTRSSTGTDRSSTS